MVIPAADDAPLREVEKPKIFGPRDDDVHKYAMEHFGYSENINTENSEDDDVETFSLDYARPENSHVVVIMYSERKAYIEARRTLVNKRATELASACMRFHHMIYGDAIVGRHFNNEAGRHW